MTATLSYTLILALIALGRKVGYLLTDRKMVPVNFRNVIQSLLITTFLTLFLFASCSKSKEEVIQSVPEQMIFGHFYGFCSGEQCIEIFKLDQENLFEDTKDKYPRSDTPYEGDYVQLSSQKYQIAKGLKDSFPGDLLDEANTVIGYPDAGDWGGLYIEYNKGGVRKFWLLDQMKSNVPTKYHDFIDKVNDKIAQLQ